MFFHCIVGYFVQMHSLYVLCNGIKKVSHILMADCVCVMHLVVRKYIRTEQIHT